MRAVVIDKPGSIDIAEVPDPAPRADEVVIAPCSADTNQLDRIADAQGTGSADAAPTGARVVRCRADAQGHPPGARTAHDLGVPGERADRRAKYANADAPSSPAQSRLDSRLNFRASSLNSVRKARAGPTEL